METPPEGHWSSGARCPAALGPPFAFRQARRQLARPCGACWRRSWRGRSSPRPGRGRWGARPGRSLLSAGRGCGRRRRRRGGRHPRRRRAGRLRPERRAKGLKQGHGERDRFGARLRRGREQVPGPEPEGAAFDSKVQPTSTTGGAPAAITLERGGLAGARSKGAGIPIRDGAANLITEKASALLTSASGHGGWGDRRRPRAQAASLASSPAPSRLAAASVRSTIPAKVLSAPPPRPTDLSALSAARAKALRAFGFGSRRRGAACEPGLPIRPFPEKGSS